MKITFGICFCFTIFNISILGENVHELLLNFTDLFKNFKFAGFICIAIDLNYPLFLEFLSSFGIQQKTELFENFANLNPNFVYKLNATL